MPGRLFVSQCDHGVDTAGAFRRKIGRKQRDGAQQNRYKNDRHGIPRFDAVEDTLHEARERQRRSGAENYFYERDLHSLNHDHAAHLMC